MKTYLFGLCFLLTATFSSAQNYPLLQKNIGYLFADLPLAGNSDTWLENMRMNKYLFKDSNFCNCDSNNYRKEFVVNSISEYTRNIAETERVFLFFFAQTVPDREGKKDIDTLMTIQSLIQLKAGFSKKEFKKIFKRLNKQVQSALPYMTSRIIGPVSKGSSRLKFSFTDKKYDLIYPVTTSYRYNSLNNSYTISVDFWKYRNGAGDLWPR